MDGQTVSSYYDSNDARSDATHPKGRKISGLTAPQDGQCQRSAMRESDSAEHRRKWRSGCGGVDEDDVRNW